MKIFNWVHRKFNGNNDVDSSSLHKDDLFNNQKMAEKVGIKSQALVGKEVVALVDVLGGWKNGILTIGTLGFDEDFKSFPFSYNELEEIYDDDDVKEKEEKVCKTQELDNENEKYPLMSKEEIVDFLEVITVCETMGKKSGERTTLADLFSADYDVVKNTVDGTTEKKHKTKKSFFSSHGEKKHDNDSKKKKHGNSLAKKLIPRIGDDSHPMKKLNQLMTRMMKRKVHPAEIEGKNTRSDGQILADARGLLNNDGLESIE